MKTFIYVSCLLLAGLPATATATDIPAPCLDRLIAEQEVALADCENRAGKIVRRDGFTYWHRPEQESSNGSRGYLAVNNIGALPGNTTAYLLKDNGSGSGVFAYLIAVQRDGARIKKTLQIEGGDRCVNGIKSARVTGDRIILQRSMTTEGLAGYLAKLTANTNATDFTHFGREDWPYCTTCCAADREITYDVSGKITHRGNLRLDLTNLHWQATNNAAVRCFLQALSTPKKDLVILEGENASRALAVKLQEHCAQ